jgi:mono/diheme cytochrome c family protein
MVRFVTTILAAFAVTLGAANAQSALVKRGDYLVNGLLTCGNCHTPKGPTGDIMDKAFSGFLEFDEPPFKVTAPNITQDKETGIGTWSAADIRKLLRTGVRPNGVTIATIMPTVFYDIITKKDMDAIVAYVQTSSRSRTRCRIRSTKCRRCARFSPAPRSPIPKPCSATG